MTLCKAKKIDIITEVQKITETLLICININILLLVSGWVLRYMHVLFVQQLSKVYHQTNGSFVWFC